jgi:signal transduction histidine kinase
VLIIFSSREQLPDEERAMLLGLADQAGLAVANARLFEQVLAGREQLRELTGYLHTAREEERTRIAREIHDEFGQVLTALKMDLAWIAKRLPEDQTTLREKAGSMSELIGNTLHMVHRIATELRPGLLDDLGLVAAIEWQAQEFTERTGIECELHLGEKAVTFDRDLSTAIFRIFQETLTNVARHAGATRVRVDVEERPGEWTLVIRDNGRGIADSQVADPRSLGLLGMRERARAWGGKVTFEGAPGQGTVVTISMPQARI